MIDFASSGITYLFDRGFFTIQVLDRIQSRQRRDNPSSKSEVSLLETMRHLENQIINEIVCFSFQQGFLLGASRILPLTSYGKITSHILKSWGH